MCAGRTAINQNLDSVDRQAGWRAQGIIEIDLLTGERQTARRRQDFYDRRQTGLDRLLLFAPVRCRIGLLHCCCFVERVEKQSDNVGSVEPVAKA
jgi:hypothetical protein